MVPMFVIRLPKEAKKTSRLMDLQKYFEKQNVEIVNRHPIVDIDEPVRSIMVMARCCASESPAMTCSGRLPDASACELWC